MNLLALALGLFTERFLTHLFHLREARWLDGLFDLGLRTIGERSGVLAMLITIMTVAVPVLPVVLLMVWFQHLLYGIPYFLFAVVMLMFSLGPRDLEEEIDEFAAAMQAGDETKANRVAKELLETEPPGRTTQRVLAIEEAIFVQANNRLFGVVLWFMLLGPIGAWTFRVSDMLRRRAIFEAGRVERETGKRPVYTLAPQRLHGVLAWLPARLVAVAYALAGSFESAVSDWRAYYSNCADHFFEVNDDVVACAGLGALGGNPDDEKVLPEVQGANRALRLVSRTLWVWLTAIAALTVVGLAV